MSESLRLILCQTVDLGRQSDSPSESLLKRLNFWGTALVFAGNNTDWAELIGNPLLAHPSAAEWFNTAVCKENPNRTLNAALALVGYLWASRRSTGSNPPWTKPRHNEFYERLEGV